MSGETEFIPDADNPSQIISIAKDTGSRKFYKLEVSDADSDFDGVSDWAERETGTDPSTGTSATNASGGTASDGDTMASLLSLSIAPVSGEESAIEKEGMSARLRLSRTGTMKLENLPLAFLGNPDATKGSATAGDYVLKDQNNTSLTTTVSIPAGAATFDLLVQPVGAGNANGDGVVEVPEMLKVMCSLPGVPGGMGPAGAVDIKDAAPVEANRRLFVAYLGREAGISSVASGIATALVSGDNDSASVSMTFSNLSSQQKDGETYIRIGSDQEVTPVSFPAGQLTEANWNIRAAQFVTTDQDMLNALFNGELFIEVRTENYPDGEIKGYFNIANGSTTFDPNNPDLVTPVLGDVEWPQPTGEDLEREIYRFLEQCTYGPTTELYNEVLAKVNAALAQPGGTYLDGLEDWLDEQMNPTLTPNPSLMTLVMAADNEEWVLRGNRPIWSSNDPQFAGQSYSISYDNFGNPIFNTGTTGAYNNNHPFHNNRRREMWTLALQAKAQVRQRMAQALGEIVVISEIDATVQSKHYGAASYWDMLADNAFGKYRTILENVTYHPMMGIYLSHLRNRATYVSGGVTISPDENYAREIMQLFSIGLVLRHPDGSLVLDESGLPISTYDNNDITEMARVMTGLCHGARHANQSNVPRFNGLVMYNQTRRVSPTIEFNTVTSGFNTFDEGGGDSWWQAPWIYPMKMIGRIGSTVYHDFGAKTLLAGKHGETVIPAQTLPGTGTSNDLTTHTMAANDLRTAHNMLAGDPNAGSYNGHQNTPVNISRWLIQRLTSSNPSAGYIYRVSEVYRNTNGNLGAVFKAILLDFEARSLELANLSNGAGRAKEPLVQFMGMIRALKGYTGIPLTTLRDAPAPFASGHSPMTTAYPQSEVDKFVPNASRFRFGDYTGVIGQSPLRAPSVFNWFLPDFQVPGPMSAAGLFAPEFQINTETNIVNRINRHWTFTWMNLAGMTTFPGVGVDDPIQVVGNGAPQVKVSATAAGSANSNSFVQSLVLTFTPSNWNTPQNVTVAALDDDISEGVHTTSIAHTGTSTDTAYNAAAMPVVNVTINDNESAASAQVIVTESGGDTVVVENGATDSYTLHLTSAPAANVTVHMNPAITDFGTYAMDVSVSPSSVTFDSTNWNTPQTVTVTAVNDTTNEGPEVGMIGHHVTTTDASYIQTNVKPVYAIVADNENNGSNAVSILQTSNTTLAVEGGATDEYRVTLRRAPTGTVTVAINGGADISTAPASLSFTTSDWNIPQKVTVTAVDDADVEGTHTQTISNVSTGGGYSITSNITATITDNDGGSILITESGGSTAVTESSPTGTSSNPVLPAGNLDSYTIALASQPTANVTITVAPVRHPARMSNWGKTAGYFIGDTTGNNSNQQKDNVIFDYSEIIAAYTAAYHASPGASGSSPSTTQIQDAHFNGTVAAVNKLDLLLTSGQLKAGWPVLTRADLSDTAIVNPRKSIVTAVFNGYSTTRHKAPGASNSTWDNEVRDRCRIAGYLVSISPQAMISK